MIPDLPARATFRGLTKAELAKIFRERPTAGVVISSEVVPYLKAPLGLSKEEYEEWVDQLCTLP